MLGRLVGACAALLVVAAVSPVAQDQARRITDPYREERFSCDGQPDGRFRNNVYDSIGYNGFRIVADLNFDSRPDLILSISEANGRGGSASCGNVGCPVTIYLLQADNTYASVAFQLHPLAAASERVGPGRGTLVTYGHHSADEGTLGWYEVIADSLTSTKSMLLHANDSTQDQELYDHWFHGPLALQAEYSWCVAGQLQWRGSLR